MEEIWKDIPEYEGLYQVSNIGRVKSLKFGRNKILIPQLQCKTKYLTVGLYKESKVSIKTIHRLVAVSFIDNPENKPQIDHINGNRIDNTVNNLRWVTPLENVRNPITLEKIRIAVTATNKKKIGKPFSNEHRKNISDSLKESTKNKGKTGFLSKLSIPVYQYDLEGNFITKYAGQTEAARENSIRQSNIWAACNGIKKSAGGYLWRYTYISKIHSNVNFKKYQRNKKVLQYDKDNNLIKEWSSAAEISKELGFRRETIQDCCNGQMTVSNGFIWRYK